MSFYLSFFFADVNDDGVYQKDVFVKLSQSLLSIARVFPSEMPSQLKREMEKCGEDGRERERKGEAGDVASIVAKAQRGGEGRRGSGGGRVCL